MNDQADCDKFCWQGVCPPKVEFFVWQLLKGRVLVKQVLNKFGISSIVSLACPLCNEEDESVDHLFIQCRLAWKIWSKGMGWWGVQGCITKSMVEWAAGWGSLCPSRECKRAWSSLFFATVWTIWEVRNNKVFNNGESEMSLALDSIQFRIAWWFKHHGCGSSVPLTSLLQGVSEFCKDPVKTKQRIVEAWVPPVLGALKFNVDGSSRGTLGLAGIGGVLRNSRGMVLCLFSLFVGFQNSITAELMAIGKACYLCVSNHSLQGIEIEIISDSLVAVNWINSDSVDSLAYANLVYDIRDQMRNHGSLSIRFFSRASNSYADSLAKKGSNKEGDIVQWGSI